MEKRKLFLVIQAQLINVGGMIDNHQFDSHNRDGETGVIGAC